MLKTVKLDNSRSSQQNLQLVTFRSSTPLRRTDVAAVEGEGVASARRLPAQAALSKLALAWLLGQVEVDVFKALPACWSVECFKRLIGAFSHIGGALRITVTPYSRPITKVESDSGRLCETEN